MSDTPTLLRRHRPACDGKHPADSYSTEAEERRHGWKKCACKIYAHGTLDGKFRRFATKARDWQFAREIVAPYLAAGSWDITPDPPPSAPRPPGSPTVATSAAARDPTVAEAAAKVLRDHRNAQSRINTIRRYGVFLREVERFSAAHGLVRVGQWSQQWAEAIRTWWQEKPNRPVTVKGKVQMLAAFFAPYVKQGILAVNPVEEVKVIKNQAYFARQGTNGRQVNPFTDEELGRMLEACPDLRPRKIESIVDIDAYRHHKEWKWHGEDLADFIEVSCWTGLRISDVGTFHIDRLTPAGEVRLRATKNGNWVSVWVPEWLQAMIRSRAVRVGPYIFGAHRTEDINVITNAWRGRLNRLWETSGPWKEKPTPHRFRHTFIRLLLERGMPVSMVAELVGDTEKMIYDHYSGWITSRQENMSRMLQEAFRNVPRYHRG